MSEQTKNTAEQAVDRKQFLFAGVYCAVLIAIFAIIGLSLGAQDSTDNKKSNSVTDATPTPGPVAAKELQLKILHMNDHHSHLVSFLFLYCSLRKEYVGDMIFS
jgi:hypothetical protein